MHKAGLLIRPNFHPNSTRHALNLSSLLVFVAPGSVDDARSGAGGAGDKKQIPSERLPAFLATSEPSSRYRQQAG